MQLINVTFMDLDSEVVLKVTFVWFLEKKLKLPSVLVHQSTRCVCDQGPSVFHFPPTKSLDLQKFVSGVTFVGGTQKSESKVRHTHVYQLCLTHQQTFTNCAAKKHLFQLFPSSKKIFCVFCDCTWSYEHLNLLIDTMP